MPRRTDRPPDVPSGVDRCGYHTPPPWTRFHVAEHAWFHLLEADTRKRARAGKDYRTGYRDLEAIAKAQRDYIAELQHLASDQRGQIRDLTDRRDELERQLDDLNRKEA